MSSTVRASNLEPGRLVELQRLVDRARALDARLAELHRQGILAAHRSYAGEEAALLGAAAAFRDDEWLAGEGHELPLALLRGAEFSDLVASGREPLMSRAKLLVASGWRNGAFVTHGVGAAWGAKIAREGRGVLVTLTEATLPTGELHNGLNFAGVFKLPVVFVARLAAGAAEGAADRAAARARAYGIRGVACDGSNLVEVMERVREARLAALAGEGPTWLEARLPKPAVEAAPAVSPEIEAELDRAVAELEKRRPSEDAGADARAALFENTFLAPTWNLREQRAKLLG